MKVAITGGTGCLGRPLVRKLLKKGLDVYLLVLPGDEAAEEFAEKVEVVEGSLESKEAVRKLTQGCDIVFHLAGKVHSVSRTKTEEDDFFRTNVGGTENLLKVCAENGVRRIIFYSTVGVYGRESDFHGDESSPCKPISAYAKSKSLAEGLIIQSADRKEPEGVVLRFPVAYGAFDRGNIAALIKGIHDRRFFFFGDGKAVRSMVSSENAAEAAVKAGFEVSARNQIFCVTDGEDHSIADLVETICLALGVEWRPPHLPFSLAMGVGALGSLGEKTLRIRAPINSATVRKLGKPLTFSCEKARRVLGYEPEESLFAGISKEVEWLRALHNWN